MWLQPDKLEPYLFRPIEGDTLKLDTTDNTETLGNVSYEDTTESKVSEAAMAHVTGLLRFLYNDPQAAVFREYTANAIDAHIAAGNPKPVTIFLPTYDTPVFTAKDFGTGMTPETLRKIFSQFGESTKRKSNTEIGGFGLGSKSGLAIASQLTIITTKDGTRTTAIYSNSEDGLAKLNIVDIRDTEEPNGTSVAVPIDDVQDFRTKAEAFFPFFEPNTVEDFESGLTEHYLTKYQDNLALTIPVSTEVAGDTSVHIFTKVSDELLTPSRWDFVTGVYLVMGGIPYIISEDTITKNLAGDTAQFIKLFSTDALMVIDAPIGSVKLSPSREGIQFNENTQGYFTDVFSTAVNEYLRKAISEIEEADTYAEAVSFTESLPHGIVNSRRIEWNGISTKGGGTFSLHNSATRYVFEGKTIRSSGSNFTFDSLNHWSTEVVYGSVSHETFRKYIGSYIREDDTPNVVRYIQHPPVKKGEEFDLDAFKESLVFYPSPQGVGVDDWGYKEYSDENSRAQFQSLTLDQVTTAVTHEFMTLKSYDDLKKEVLAIRREKAKAARLARKLGETPEEKVKMATKYLTLVAGEDETSGTSVSDIIDLDSYVFVTSENVGKWKGGQTLLQASVQQFNSYGLNENDASIIGDLYKGKTFVFVTGNRSIDHALKVLSGPKVIQFSDQKFLDKLKKMVIKAMDVKGAQLTFLKNQLPEMHEYHIDKIRDPELRKVYKSGPNSDKDHIRWMSRYFVPEDVPEVNRSVFTFYNNTDGWNSNSRRNREKFFGYNALLQKYTLLSLPEHIFYDKHSDHLVQYFNVIHSKDKSKFLANSLKA